MANSKKPNLEEAVLDEALSLDTMFVDPYLSLNSDEDEEFGNNKVMKELKGEELCRFLGIKAKPHFYLARKDIKMIHAKFGRFFKQLIQAGKDVDKHFWNHINVRVYNKRSLESVTLEKITGKMTGSGISSKAKPVEYAGAINKGSVILDYLAQVKNATKHREYLICLVSMNITEDMELVSN